MKKLIYTGILIAIFAFVIPPMNIKAATKTYTISEETSAPKKYQKLSTYNPYTKDYYIFRNAFEQCAKNKGGKVVIKKGKYVISNAIGIPSNTTVILEDGAVIKKGTSTGTDKLKASLSIFHLVNQKYISVKGHYSKYSGEHDITIMGEGTAIMDVDYLERGLAIIIGHNKNVTIKNIQFKNLNGGHFIEMDASLNTLVDGCTFENAKEWGKTGFKEAINIDTPDYVTHGFNSVWSSHDKTPNQDTHITNCTFKNLESGIGTHGVSKLKNSETGLYDITQWHTNVKIDYCKFINISRTSLRIYGWKDCDIEYNEFSNDIRNSCSIFEGWCVNNPTFKNNIMNNLERIGYVNAIGHYTMKDGVIVCVPGQPYEPDYSYLAEQNITDFYQNKAINMDDAVLMIYKGIAAPCPKGNLKILGKDMKANN